MSEFVPQLFQPESLPLPPLASHAEVVATRGAAENGLLPPAVRQAAENVLSENKRAHEAGMQAAHNQRNRVHIDNHLGNVYDKTYQEVYGNSQNRTLDTLPADGAGQASMLDFLDRDTQDRAYADRRARQAVDARIGEIETRGGAARWEAIQQEDKAAEENSIAARFARIHEMVAGKGPIPEVTPAEPAAPAADIPAEPVTPAPQPAAPQRRRPSPRPYPADTTPQPAGTFVGGGQPRVGVHYDWQADPGSGLHGGDLPAGATPASPAETGVASDETNEKPVNPADAVPAPTAARSLDWADDAGFDDLHRSAPQPAPAAAPTTGDVAGAAQAPVSAPAPVEPAQPAPAVEAAPAQQPAESETKPDQAAQPQEETLRQKDERADREYWRNLEEGYFTGGATGRRRYREAINYGEDIEYTGNSPLLRGIVRGINRLRNMGYNKPLPPEEIGNDIITENRADKAGLTYVPGSGTYEPIAPTTYDQKFLARQERREARQQARADRRAAAEPTAPGRTNTDAVPTAPAPPIQPPRRPSPRPVPPAGPDARAAAAAAANRSPLDILDGSSDQS